MSIYRNKLKPRYMRGFFWFKRFYTIRRRGKPLKRKRKEKGNETVVITIYRNSYCIKYYIWYIQA